MTRDFIFLATILLTAAVCHAQEKEPEKTKSTAESDNTIAIKALVRLTRDQDSGVRMSAYSAIARIGEQTPDVIQAVQSGLEDDERGVRIEAFGALCSAIDDGKIKVDALLLLIRDEDEELALKASEQLGRLGQSAVPHLLEALKNEPSRRLIVRTLGSMRSEARAAIPALVELLKSDDPGLRSLVATCIADICRPRTTSSAAAFSRTRSRGPDSETVRRMVDALWPRYDRDGDGVLSLEEQAGVRSLDGGADANGDMKISRSEFSSWYLSKVRRQRDPRTETIRTFPGGGFGGGR